MAKYEHVYSITNENLTAYQDLYNFSNARVLTVLGSGDQYLAALLYGAKDVEVFDANFLAWYFFNLKIAAIKVLSYEEFFHFFIESELSDMDYYLKIRNYLTNVFRNFFDQFIRVNGSIKKLCHSSKLFMESKY